MSQAAGGESHSAASRWSEICHLDGNNGLWPSPAALLKTANLANLAKMANISGTGWSAIFVSGSSMGSERAKPLAAGDALLVHRATLDLAGRMEGLVADSMGRDQAMPPHGHHQVVESVVAHRHSQSRREDERLGPGKALPRPRENWFRKPGSSYIISNRVLTRSSGK
jgi:hypothetical protein